MSNYEILFYNALLVAVPAILLAYFLGDIQRAYEFENWTNPLFLLFFVLSCIMG